MIWIPPKPFIDEKETHRIGVHNFKACSIDKEKCFAMIRLALKWKNII